MEAGPEVTGSAALGGIEADPLLQASRDEPSRMHRRLSVTTTIGIGVLGVLCVAALAVRGQSSHSPQPRLRAIAEIVGMAAEDAKKASAVTYVRYIDKNAFEGAGAKNIDSNADAPTGYTELQCQQRCTEDAACDCVSWQRSNGKCWKRRACDPSGWTSKWNAGDNVYMKAETKAELEKLVAEGGSTTAKAEERTDGYEAKAKLPDAKFVHCTPHEDSDFDGTDVETFPKTWGPGESRTVVEAINYAGDFGYKGFAYKDGHAFMKWSPGAEPLTRKDLVPLKKKSGVTFYTCEGAYLQTTRITTTSPPATTTLPPTTTVPPVVVDNVNGRFRKANPDGGLWEAGVLVHQWDNMEGTGHDQMWWPCQADWCVAFKDRFSFSLINKEGPPMKGRIGLFSDTGGGFIVSPAKADVLCSYPSDGGSMAKECSKDGSPIADCVPGCDKEVCSAEMWWTCSFPPDQLALMFQMYQKNPARYNEVVIGTANWDPPTSIEAFFYPAGKMGCGDCDKDCAKVRDQHSGYLQTFSMTSAQVPLLCLDINNWDYPFADMSDQV